MRSGKEKKGEKKEKKERERKKRSGEEERWIWFFMQTRIFLFLTIWERSFSVIFQIKMCHSSIQGYK